MAGKRILVVDDEAPIVDLLTSALTEAGFVVDSASNATDALALVKDRLFDAAILDFALPDMNGVMLHSRIRQMDEELAGKTLFISGVTQAENDMSYYTSMAGGFLAKPFNVMEVVSTLHKITADP